MSNKASLLFITDLYYQANNREYFREDLYVTAQLKNDFDIVICHPLHSEKFEHAVDLIVIRNSGPTIYYKEYFDRFFKRINSQATPIFNALDGRGDMRGKDYLVTLTKAGFPVIPTFDNVTDVNHLSETDRFVVKPKEGADSIGARIVDVEDLPEITLANDIIQPFIDFKYEVSFYFINNVFQYALYAPNKDERWKLEKYLPNEDDLAFARKFVEWNTMKWGIQRVDACRTKPGELVLVELEDLNPYLSLDLLDTDTRDNFISNFKNALQTAIQDNTKDV
jgi:hypothetical protein